MPIQPPRLDDRSYEDLVREARALIPQYCPEWTHLGDSDPGMTLVQLFAWMTEMTLYRLNRVPDKTYVHFLNFIGEERRNARPSVVPLTFALRQSEAAVVELPAAERCSTRQRQGGDALHFLTSEPVSVHGARVDRIVAVAAGPQPMSREIAWEVFDEGSGALRFGDRGLSLLDLDPSRDGPNSYTADHWLYLRHDDFLRMGRVDAGEGPGGALRLRSVLEVGDEGAVGLPVAGLFAWEYPRLDGEGWTPVAPFPEPPGEVMGLPEPLLAAELPLMAPIAHFGAMDDPIAWPEDLPQEGWIRGRLDVERWLAELMGQEGELTITWRDDRGGEEHEITSWQVRAVGRTLEFFVPNVPPLRPGWTLRFTLVDHGLRLGREGVFPRYAWSWRRGDMWEPVPAGAVEQVGASFVLTGPLLDLAADGFNLRAERRESVDLFGVLPSLRIDAVWQRPADVFLAWGPEVAAASEILAGELPVTPFQPLPTLPALLGMKFFIGSDLLANRRREPVLLELDVAFERDGELVAEPDGDYHLQLTYRTSAGWQTVQVQDLDLSRFTFADLDPDGAPLAERRGLRLALDPAEHLPGIAPTEVGQRTTCWLRIELTRAALSYQTEPTAPPSAVTLRVHDARISLERIPGAQVYDEPLPGTRMVAVEHRPTNRRFTRMMRRKDGDVVSSLPFDPQIAIEDPDGGHRALYLRFDRPLPVGSRLHTMFLQAGETWLPRGFSVHWELLQEPTPGVRRWTRLTSGTAEESAGAWRMDRSGSLTFSLDQPMRPAPEGIWLRGLFRASEGRFPALPPVTHLLPNTVEAKNLHGFRMEKFSGEGIPGQLVQLRHQPLWLPDAADVARDRTTDLAVWVDEGDAQPRAWRVAPGNSFVATSKDDRVFVVDAVDGTLTFGNGIRGRILPIGTFNVTVASYHVIPGASGNVAAGEIALSEGFADVVDVINLLPAVGGRDAETVDEIVRRAPSVLTSRDRAVTRKDFEVIATEASPEVARAAVVGSVGADGGIEVVILPRKRAHEALPDPFLSAGLLDHVQHYVQRRCLVNVRPKVRLATFQAVDVSLDVRLRAHADVVAAREAAQAWVRTFLDPWGGGLDGEGWPFGATVFAADFGRLVLAVPEVRHVVDVRLFPVAPVPEGGRVAPPGWETSPGDAVLSLPGIDLFLVREVRIRWAEERA